MRDLVKEMPLFIISAVVFGQACQNRSSLGPKNGSWTILRSSNGGLALAVAGKNLHLAIAARHGDRVHRFREDAPFRSHYVELELLSH